MIVKSSSADEQAVLTKMLGWEPMKTAQKVEHKEKKWANGFRNGTAFHVVYEAETQDVWRFTLDEKKEAAQFAQQLASSSGARMSSAARSFVMKYANAKAVPIKALNHYRMIDIWSVNSVNVRMESTIVGERIFTAQEAGEVAKFLQQLRGMGYAVEPSSASNATRWANQLSQ